MIPEGVVHVAKLAFDFQRTFKHDVVIDLVGYRRWGHNEGDEPAYTQPTMYAKIKTHPSVAAIYGEKLVASGVLSREELESVWATKRAAMQQVGNPPMPEPKTAAVELPDPDASALSGRIRATLQGLTTIPVEFEVHPKLMPFLKKRQDLLEGRGRGEVDWATAESLAFGTLLLEGTSVRLSGQDVGRGTFSQRHAILYDHRDAKEFVPLQQLAAGGARFDVYDSLLSECAVMGFEFGYSAIHNRSLVLWEAQFGDFVNGAQVIVDQFLAASEQKWNQQVGLTLLLPHGHEGQGPEHSSARIERFLNLCAEDNLRVAYPSTPASLFHLLRAQGRSVSRKPLVVFTPKSLLRAPQCVSTLPELAEGRFYPVLSDGAVDPAMVRRVLVTSGKVTYDLLKERETRGARDIAIVRVERLYPFPGAELSAALRTFPVTAEVAWVQEEPANMGAWRFIRERFLDGDVAGFEHRALSYIGRDASASPAPGSHKVHVREQEELLANRPPPGDRSHEVRHALVARRIQRIAVELYAVVTSRRDVPVGGQERNHRALLPHTDLGLVALHSISGLEPRCGRLPRLQRTTRGTRRGGALRRAGARFPRLPKAVRHALHGRIRNRVLVELDAVPAAGLVQIVSLERHDHSLLVGPVLQPVALDAVARPEPSLGAGVLRDK
jgi:2-oxoglutarate dehydrogenase complex dehydrogenase (E1) component-like enzyme